MSGCAAAPGVIALSLGIVTADPLSYWAIRRRRIVSPRFRARLAWSEGIPLLLYLGDGICFEFWCKGSPGSSHMSPQLGCSVKPQQVSSFIRTLQSFIYGSQSRKDIWHQMRT